MDAEKIAALVATYGENPQDVGAADGTEDDFGDLISEVADLLGIDCDSDAWLTVDRLCGESEATTMEAFVLDVEDGLRARVWTNQHAPDCAVTKERRDLLRDLAKDPANAVLHGAAAEYDLGGDQEVENCTCNRDEGNRMTENADYTIASGGVVIAQVEHHDATTPREAREVLVHLNVTVPAGDGRSPDEVADAILAAIEVGSDHDRVRDLVVVAPLAEEV